MPAPKGHAKWGGKKRGYKFPKTLAKEAARERVRQFVQEHMAEMLAAQAQHAIGISHFMLRREDGTFERATSPEAILAALNSGDENSYYVFTKDPSVQAFTDLMNRALDKPKEQAQDVNLNVSGDLSVLIAEGRARAHARNKKG